MYEFNRRVSMKKVSSVLSKARDWEWVVGADPAEASKSSEAGISASATAPVYLRKDTADCFQWRVRNLPYPKEV